MICPQLKSSALQLVTKMPDGGESGEELAVKSTVDHMWLFQLLREEAQGLPPC